MATSSSNRKVVPEAMDALDKFKYEVASDIAVKNIFKSAVRTNVSYGWLMQRAKRRCNPLTWYLLATFLFMLFFY